MRGKMRYLLLVAMLGSVLFVTGCAAAQIPNTDLVDTPANREIVNLLERYRSAMETRDTQVLRSLASKHYYENASTTWSSTDDWGYADLDAVLAQFKEHVMSVTYDVKITDVQLKGDRADVDYELTWAFQYTDGDRDAWTRKTDVNRLELVREDGGWRILSGM